jgi:hypothetical protein
LAGFILPAVLSAGGDNREDQREAESRRSNMSQPVHTMMTHGRALTRHENKSEIDAAQRFLCKDTALSEQLKNETG